MAKNKVQALEGSVAELVGQQSTLRARILELERELDADVDVDVDALAAVDRLGEVGDELARLRRVLPAVDKRLTLLRAELDAARAVEDEKACKALWPKERKAADRVVKLTTDLETALLDLQGVQGELIAHRGMVKTRVGPSLWPAVMATCQDWRHSGFWHGEGGTG